MEKELMLFKSKDSKVYLEVNISKDTAWLNQAQMTKLFEVDRTSVTKHINNAIKEGEIEEESNVQILHIANSDRPVKFYSLDVIISVGYRVKSQRGVEFRRWANSVLKDYIIQGYAANDTRLNQLNQMIQVMKRAEYSLDVKQVLSVIENYSTALELLDNYDHQIMRRPKGQKAVYIITYQECRDIIKEMKYSNDSEIFGKEKDDSFKGSIAAIYQTYGGDELYPSLEEKSANLLYFITKDHSFFDGNKRIAAMMFLHFLNKNGALIINKQKVITDYTLVALTIMIAESKPEEKEMMISIVMNCLDI